MAMTSTVTLAYEGAPACRDCQRIGEPVCSHVGFNPEAWINLPGTAVHVPGLDPLPDYQHIVRHATVSEDRKAVTLIVDTRRPLHLDLARHLTTLPGPRAVIRGVHHDTGDVLALTEADAPLHAGQRVHVNGDPHHVVRVEYPHRDPDGVATAGVDEQWAYLRPLDPETVTPADLPDRG